MLMASHALLISPISTRGILGKRLINYFTPAIKHQAWGEAAGLAPTC
jgi:hypothetical protein